MFRARQGRFSKGLRGGKLELRAYLLAPSMNSEDNVGTWLIVIHRISKQRRVDHLLYPPLPNTHTPSGPGPLGGVGMRILYYVMVNSSINSHKFRLVSVDHSIDIESI